MVYRISAPTPEEKDEWIHSIKCVQNKTVTWCLSPCFEELHTLPRSRYVFWLSSVQVCCQCRPLLWNAGCQEEAYITEEEGGAAVDQIFSSSPHLPSLPLSRLLPNLASLLQTCYCLTSVPFLFFLFIIFLRLLKVAYSEGLWPPLPLGLDLDSHSLLDCSPTKLSVHTFLHTLCLLEHRVWLIHSLVLSIFFCKTHVEYV